MSSFRRFCYSSCTCGRARSRSWRAIYSFCKLRRTGNCLSGRGPMSSSRYLGTAQCRYSGLPYCMYIIHIDSTHRIHIVCFIQYWYALVSTLRLRQAEQDTAQKEPRQSHFPIGASQLKQSKIMSGTHEPLHRSPGEGTCGHALPDGGWG